MPAPPTPAWAVRLACVALRTEPSLVLAGRRCVPRRLLDAGFAFRFADLDACCRDLAGTGGQGAAGG